MDHDGRRLPGSFRIDAVVPGLGNREGTELRCIVDSEICEMIQPDKFFCFRRIARYAVFLQRVIFGTAHIRPDCIPVICIVQRDRIRDGISVGILVDRRSVRFAERHRDRRRTVRIIAVFPVFECCQ